MIRAAIYAAMLCCPLTIAASASAECAWVLWPGMANPVPGPLLQYVPASAWAGRADCEKERARVNQPPATQRPGSDVISVCLPDTVDPRGVKGAK